MRKEIREEEDVKGEVEREKVRSKKRVNICVL